MITLIIRKWNKIQENIEWLDKNTKSILICLILHMADTKCDTGF